MRRLSGCGCAAWLQVTVGGGLKIIATLQGLLNGGDRSVVVLAVCWAWWWAVMVMVVVMVILVVMVEEYQGADRC